MGIRFTAEDEANIGAWLAEGVSVKECAKRFGRTYDVVRRWSIRLGLLSEGSRAQQSWVPWSPDDDRILLNGIRDGTPTKEIAEWLGRSISGCQNRIWIIRRDAKAKPQSLNAPSDYILPDDIYGLWSRANDAVRRMQNERSQ